MTRGRTTAYIALGLAGVVLGWTLYALPRRQSAPSVAVGTPPPAAPAATSSGGRKIKARLFYVNDDGVRLTGVERDVAYGESASDQAREIVAAQIAPVAEPLVSAVPRGTQLRALFITDKGEAYVDLSRDVVVGHPGGSINELLTVYTLVNALSANLPAITAVQLLVDGKQVDTLAGHVDLRRPLVKNLSWVQ
jgi:Sporulation and spore germination